MFVQRPNAPIEMIRAMLNRGLVVWAKDMIKRKPKLPAEQQAKPAASQAINTGKGESSGRKVDQGAENTEEPGERQGGVSDA